MNQFKIVNKHSGKGKSDKEVIINPDVNSKINNFLNQDIFIRISSHDICLHKHSDKWQEKPQLYI